MFPFMNIQILMEEIIKQESKAVIISAEMSLLSLIVSPSKGRPRYSSVQCKQNHSSKMDFLIWRDVVKLFIHQLSYYIGQRKEIIFYCN